MNAVFNPFTGLPDFVGTSSGGSGGAFPGIILQDINGFFWAITIDTSGHLLTNMVTSVPAGYFYPNSFVLKDYSGSFWTITIDTSGHLITSSGGSQASVINNMVINDSSLRSWILTIDNSGHLVTA